MYLIIDTETSGLFDFRAPADAEGQPRLASVAMLFCDDKLRLVAAHSMLVRPDGWEMPAEAEQINGLSTEFLRDNGECVDLALEAYAGAIEDGYVVVAHNAQYDTKVMRGEFRRVGRPDLFAQTRKVCTMQALTDICAIPSPRGRGFKWPKLSEAVERVLKREHVNAHGCLADAMACLDLARWLDAQGRLPSPAVGLAA